MNEQMRVQLETGVRVLDHCRANPSDSPGQEAAVARLGEAVGRAKALMGQEIDGTGMVRGSVLSREQIRDAIVGRIRVLAGVARAARKELPADAVKIKVRTGNTSNILFTAQAKSACARGLANREVLEKHGLPAGLLDELKLLLDQFEATFSATNAGRRAHTGAHAELVSLTDEIMQLVRQLDALNVHRFRNDAERLGAWKNARDVHWPNSQAAAKRKARPAEPPTPGEGGSKEPAA